MNSKTNPFLIKVFEANSGHITENDDKLLQCEDMTSLVVYKVIGGEILYGYLIYTYLDDQDTFTKKSLMKDGYSEALCNLLELAKNQGCKFLQLDGDGTQYEDLPTFDW